MFENLNRQRSAPGFSFERSGALFVTGIKHILVKYCIYDTVIFASACNNLHRRLIMSELEELQEMLNCINENLIVLARDQQKIYILLEQISKEIKKE
jgi:deoxyribodipyrimidine photolyase